MTPSNAELREAILWAIKSQFEGLDCSHLGHKDEEAARLPGQALEDATNDVLTVFQAREQQLLTELLGELPEKKNYLAGIDREYINGGNDMLGQVVSVIERLQNKTNDGGS